MAKDIRVKYVEDGGYGPAIRSAFRTGLQRSDRSVTVEHDLDFYDVLAELESGNLADVYIFDNEITGEYDQIGAEIAMRVYDKAHELNKDVLVITLLCSNTSEVRKQYGTGLFDRGVPILQKNFHASTCGFYVAACIEAESTIPFDKWVRREGINLKSGSEGVGGDIQVIEGRMLSTAEDNSGSFYLSPRAFIDKFGIRKLLDSKAQRYFDELYPPLMSGRAETMLVS